MQLRIDVWIIFFITKWKNAEKIAENLFRFANNN